MNPALYYYQTGQMPPLEQGPQAAPRYDDGGLGQTIGAVAVQRLLQGAGSGQTASPVAGMAQSLSMGGLGLPTAASAPMAAQAAANIGMGSLGAGAPATAGFGGLGTLGALGAGAAGLWALDRGAKELLGDSADKPAGYLARALIGGPLNFSLGYDLLKDAFGSGKNPRQQQRDTVRDYIGQYIPNRTFQNAQGQNVQIEHHEVDKNKPELGGYAIGIFNPVADIIAKEMAGEDAEKQKSYREDIAALFGRAATENAANQEEVLANAQQLIRAIGIETKDAYNAFDKATEYLDAPTKEAYRGGLQQVFGTPEAPAAGMGNPPDPVNDFLGGMDFEAMFQQARQQYDQIRESLAPHFSSAVGAQEPRFRITY